MKRFVIGFLLGSLLTAGTLYASGMLKIVLHNSAGTEIGTASNPIIVQGV